MTFKVIQSRLRYFQYETARVVMTKQLFLQQVEIVTSINTLLYAYYLVGKAEIFKYRH